LRWGLAKWYSYLVKLFTNGVSVEEAFGQFCEWLETRGGFAERTRVEYRDDVKHLVLFLTASCRLTNVRSVERNHLVRYLSALTTAGQAASTRRRAVAAIRLFFQVLVQEDVVQRSPAQHLIPPAREDRPPRVLTKSEYEHLRITASDDARTAALVELILQTGMSLGELSRLLLPDVTLPSPATMPGIGSVRIAGRNHRRRTVTLNSRACSALQTYLGEREDGDDHLFTTRTGKGLGRRSIETLIKKACKQAGLRGVSVRTLRHTFAVHSLAKGTTIETMQKALGLASPVSVEDYLDAARQVMDEELQRNAL